MKVTSLLPVIILLMMLAIVLIVPARLHQLKARAETDTIADLDSDLPLNRHGVEEKQVGSWDRTGHNNDFNNFVDESPDGTVVLFDEDGPGRIDRFWMTGINNNTIEIYIDGETTPRVRAGMQDLFNGSVPGFPKPLVLNDRESSGGFVSYVPIAFAKHIRIVTSRRGIGSFYYNITFAHFTDNRQIDSFDPSRTSADQNVWNDGRSDVTAANPTHVELQQGQSAELRTSAPGIREMVFSGLPDDPKFLRNAVLRVYYDGKPFPSVESPLGDLVASPFYWTSVDSRMFSMDPDSHTITLKWPIVAKRGVRVTLTNDGDTAVSFTYSDDEQQAPITDASNMGYFHAQFRLVNTEANDGQDLMFLDRKGAGHYVGSIESVEGTNGLWFLEGDERVFVDSDVNTGSITDVPSLHGTGTEDYYNGGWYFDHGPFSTPTHGAPIRQDNGVISMYRLHLTDTVPFQDHIQFGIEHGNENDSAEKYGVVAMWYQSDLQPLDSQLGTPEERAFHGQVQKPIQKQPGMIDALDMQVADNSPGLVYGHQQLGGRWLNFDHFWIAKSKPGDHVALNLPVDKAGDYQISAAFTKASDYGQWRVMLDGQQLADLDLYDPNVVPTGNIALGTLSLSAGNHRLELECIGTNPASRGVRYMGGLDYVWLH